METAEMVAVILFAWFVGALGLCVAFMKAWIWLRDREDQRADR